MSVTSNTHMAKPSLPIGKKKHRLLKSAVGEQSPAKKHFSQKPFAAGYQGGANIFARAKSIKC